MIHSGPPVFEHRRAKEPTMRLSRAPDNVIYLESGVIWSKHAERRSRRSSHERTMSAPDNVVDYNDSRNSINLGVDATSDLVGVRAPPLPERGEHVSEVEPRRKDVHAARTLTKLS